MRWWIRSRSELRAATARRRTAFALSLLWLHAAWAQPPLRVDGGVPLPGAVGAGVAPGARADAGAPLPADAGAAQPGSSAVDKPEFGPPLDPITVEARVLSDQARTAYEGGQFREALRLYTEAYRKRPLPGFLFNIGQSHRQLGNAERAAFFFGRYLDVAPDAPNVELARSLLAETEQKAHAQLDEERKKLERVVAEATAARQRAEQDAAAARALAAKPPPPPEGLVIGPGLLRSGWFWAGAGTVAAIAVGAAVIARPVPRTTTLGTVELR